MSDNWIVGNLQSAFETWNGKISEIWSLITTTPQAFHGGAIWTTIVTINEALKAVGLPVLKTTSPSVVALEPPNSCPRRSCRPAVSVSLSKFSPTKSQIILLY